MLGLWWAVLSHCFSNSEPGLLPGSRAQPPAPPQDWPSQVQAPPASLSPWDSCGGLGDSVGRLMILGLVGKFVLLGVWTVVEDFVDVAVDLCCVVVDL